jgi:outer membrane protein insertion porin family
MARLVHAAAVLLSAILAVLLPGALPAGAAGERIASIAVEGLSRVDRANIDRVLPFKAGDEWSGELATAAVTAVFRLGAFSRVAVDDAPAGASEGARGEDVAVTVRVAEYPVIRGVALEGNSAISTEDLKKGLTMKTFGFFDPADYPAQIAAIRKAYEAKGYTAVAVTPRTEKGAGGVRVVFAIEEGRRDLVVEIDILGNRALEDAEVRGVMSSDEKGAFSWISDSGVLDRDKLALDLERIRLAYWDHGYLEVKVEEPILRKAAGGDGLYLGIRVEEGTQYRTGSVTLDGDWPSRDRATALVTVAPGEVLERTRLAGTIKALEDSVKDQGYARARVTPRISPAAEAGTMDVALSLVRGPLVRIRRIDISGNHKTRDYVIRQEMRLQEGDIYNQGRLDESLRLVRALGFFNTVEIRPVEIAGEEERMDLAVRVVEGSSGTLSAGLGFSSQDGLTGTLQHSQRNMFGRGQRLNLSVEKGSNATNYTMSFTEPRLFMGDWSLGVDLFDTLREYGEYTESRTGGGMRLGYRFSDVSSINLRYRYTSFDVRDVDPAASELIQEMAGRSTTSAVRVGFMLDNRDYPLDPRHGYTLELSQELAGGPLGGTNEFLRTQLEGSVYRPLAGDVVGSAHMVAGVVFPPRQGTVPVTERYFLGGLYSMRGFEYRRVGPLDEDGEPIGGDRELMLNLEATYPLVAEPNIKAVLFLDAGNVWGSAQDVSLGDLRYGAGMGFRWYSPMGLLRLEWGTNLDPRPGERQPGWEFTIGTSF